MVFLVHHHPRVAESFAIGLSPRRKLSAEAQVENGGGLKCTTRGKRLLIFQIRSKIFRGIELNKS